MIAHELIDEARDYHPEFHRRFGGEKPPLRRLSRIEQALAAHIAREEPDALSVHATIELPAITDALAADGTLTIPDYIIIPVVRGVIVTASGGGEVPIRQIDRTQQLKGGAPFPSVSTANRALRLTDLRRVGISEHGWEEIEAIRYDYVPLPPSLVAPTDELTLPDGLGGVLVAMLAEWMALRLKMTTEAREIRTERREATADFLDTVRLQGRGENWHVLDGGR